MWSSHHRVEEVKIKGVQIHRPSEVLRQAAVKLNVWQIIEEWKERKVSGLNSKSKLKMPKRNKTEERWRESPEAIKEPWGFQQMKQK